MIRRPPRPPIKMMQPIALDLANSVTSLPLRAWLFRMFTKHPCALGILINKFYSLILNRLEQTLIPKSYRPFAIDLEMISCVTSGEQLETNRQTKCELMSPDSLITCKLLPRVNKCNGSIGSISPLARHIFLLARCGC